MIRRWLAGLVLALLALGCAGCADDPLSIPLEPGAGWLHVTGAETHFRSHPSPTLVLRPRGPVTLRLPERTWDVAERPLLHVSLRALEPTPEPAQVTVTALKASVDAPRPPQVPLELGTWSVGRTTDVWVDLSHLPLEPFDGFLPRVKDIAVRLPSPPPRLEVLEVSLHRRSPSTMAARWRSWPDASWNLPVNIAAVVGSLLLGIVAAFWESGRVFARLPHPRGAAAFRNTLVRSVRRTPHWSLRAALGLAALSLFAHLGERLMEVPSEWRRSGSVSDREQWAARAARLHPDFPKLIARARAASRESGEFEYRAPRGLRSPDGLAQFLAHPSRITAGADLAAYLTPYPLPTIAQRGRSAYAKVRREDFVGQTYKLPGHGRYVVALKLHPRGLQPGERLQARLFATMRGRKVHGVAESEDGMFRFEPPVPLPGNSELFFDVQLRGTGDGRYALGVSSDDRYRDGFGLLPSGGRTTDLAFIIWLSPPGYHPIQTIGGESTIFRRNAEP